MTDKLAIFKEKVSKKPLAINPRQVRYVAQVNEDDVQVIFDEGQMVVVEGTFRWVVSELEKN
jgi:hypothetical protein